MFDVSSTKLTMKDVAKEVGCHVSTVSLALKGDRRISSATRERIVLAAKRLGYQIHPLVAAWIKSRRAGKSITAQLPLAFIDWRGDQTSNLSEDIFGVIQGEADKHGFAVSRFYVDDYIRNIDRLFHVLSVRNVPGIILGPGLNSKRFEDVDWSDFSVVAVGDGPAGPLVHRVLDDRSSVVKEAFEACRSNGFRRVGLVLSKSYSAMDHGHWLSSFIHEQLWHLDRDERLPVFLDRYGSDTKERDRWFFDANPDVVLGDDRSIVDGRSVRFIDITQTDIFSSKLRNEDRNALGRATVELLVSLVTSNTKGIPNQRRSVFVDLRAGVVESFPADIESRDYVSSVC